MTVEQQAKIDALQYAISICKMRNTCSIKVEAYKSALDDICVFLEAAITRVECGERLEDIAYVQ